MHYQLMVLLRGGGAAACFVCRGKRRAVSGSGGVRWEVLLMLLKNCCP